MQHERERMVLEFIKQNKVKDIDVLAEKFNLNPKYLRCLLYKWRQRILNESYYSNTHGGYEGRRVKQRTQDVFPEEMKK